MLLVFLILGAGKVIPAIAQDTETSEAESNDTPIERIEVLGRRFIPEHQGSDGAFTLNRDFIDNLLKGNGNITDLLLFLPGVQGAEDALSADKQAEIRSQLISISGAQPWQTAFVLDGFSNSSLIDPGAADRAETSINDVQGHPEAMFINQELVGNVTVYDSNVPARYGSFVGGVVDVELREPYNTPRFSLDYRRSYSGWNEYRLIDSLERNDETFVGGEELPRSPEFDKETWSFSARLNPASNQTLVLSGARTTSLITEISLDQPAYTQRESVSASAQWSIRDVGVDSLTLTASVAPYEGQHILVNVKDSEFTQEGGGFRGSARINHLFENWSTSARLGWSESENSRSAPTFYLPWLRAAGKDWGLNVGETPFSIEGGYGDLNKTQNMLTFSNDWQRDLGERFGAYHRIELGLQVDHVDLERERPRTSAIYNGAFRDANIDCGDATFDCIEQSYEVSLDELAERLGGTIDFTNPEHVRAFEKNLLARGQFFTYRRVYPQENIEVSLLTAGTYLELSSEWNDFTLHSGLRLDYDDFLGNINLGWRLRGDYKFTEQTRLFGGLNRYYSANLITYAVREQQRPYLTQYRPINNGVVGDWITATQADRFRYRFDNVKTPHSDEFTLGLRQQVLGGYLSLRGVYRQNQNLITRGPSLREDGFTYLFQTNEGASEHARISLSYYREWDRHGLMFNTSWTENSSSAASYDDTVENVPEDELVFLLTRTEGRANYQLLSLDDLTRRQEDFSRPLTANLVLRSDWSDHWQTSLTMNYVGDYESAVNTNILREVDRNDEICSDCEIGNLSYYVYEQVNREARVTLNGMVNWQGSKTRWGQLKLTLEISNLLNSRTYLVGPNQIDWEVGRAYWLGVNYQW